MSIQEANEWFRRRTNGSGGELKRLPNGIMEGRPYLANQLTRRGGPIGPGPVGEQHNSHGGIEVDPKGAPAEAEVTDGVAGEVFASRRVV
jgi:hypothetical protein